VPRAPPLPAQSDDGREHAGPPNSQRSTTAFGHIEGSALDPTACYLIACAVDAGTPDAEPVYAAPLGPSSRPLRWPRTTDPRRLRGPAHRATPRWPVSGNSRAHGPFTFRLVAFTLPARRSPEQDRWTPDPPGCSAQPSRVSAARSRGARVTYTWLKTIAEYTSLLPPGVGCMWLSIGLFMT
jgi:hypothetical protein